MLAVVGYIHSFHYGQKFVSPQSMTARLRKLLQRAHNRAEIVFLGPHYSTERNRTNTFFAGENITACNSNPMNPTEYPSK